MVYILQRRHLQSYGYDSAEVHDENVESAKNRKKVIKMHQE